MSTFAQSLTTTPLTAEAYRLLKAKALSLALTACRTPTDAVRFLYVSALSTELRQRQRVAEAALRAGR